MDARSIFVLFLVSVFVFSVAELGGQDNQVATIHVINSMPRDSESMQIRCNSRYTDHGMHVHQLNVGDDYQFGVQETALSFCAALSGRQIAFWHGFQPRIDGNNEEVFWLVKEDGLFLSWDNSSWIRKSEWQTE